MTGIKPIKQRRAGAADMQEAGRTGSETHTDTHGHRIFSEITAQNNRTTARLQEAGAGMWLKSLLFLKYSQKLAECPVADRISEKAIARQESWRHFIKPNKKRAFAAQNPGGPHHNMGYCR